MGSSGTENPFRIYLEGGIRLLVSVGLILVFRISRQKRAITKHSL
jgi:hypothetical protein